MLTTPKFHHLHLNSIDPDAAIDFYTRQFPSTSRGSWGAFPALRSPNDVMLLFTKVEQPPASEPQSAIWHFGWHVTDSRRCLETYKPRVEVELLPLYTSEEGGEVLISSDTWPGQGARSDQGADRRSASEGRWAGRRRRFRLHERPGRCPRRVCRRPPGRALQPRPSLPGGSAVRAALVREAFECSAAGRLGRGTGE